MSLSFPDQVLKFADRNRNLGAGETLFRAGDRVNAIFLVVQGEVRLIRQQADGSHIILQRARSGQVVAESSRFAERYHCDGIAVTETRLAGISLGSFRRHEADASFALAFARHLAWELQRTRAKAEILAIKSVSGRIDAWLALNGSSLPAKGEWKDLAGEIGVTPEALYRELARRRARAPAVLP